MSNHLPTVTIGIPAYNEEANIGILVREVLRQKLKNVRLDKVIVSSDGSNDDTVKIVKDIKNKLVELVDNKDRQGKARGLNQIIRLCESDILVILDADVSIKDPGFVEKLVKPIRESQVDLTSAAIKEVDQRNFFSEMIAVSMRLKSVLFDQFRNGNNMYTCHGPARGFSKKFFKSLNFPFSVGEDMYSYLVCISKGFSYQYVREAVAYYKAPTNLRDHEKQSLRFFQTEGKQLDVFERKLVKQGVVIPWIAYIKASFLAVPIIIKYPIHCLTYVGIVGYLRVKSWTRTPIADTWDMAVSTRALRNLK